MARSMGSMKIERLEYRIPISPSSFDCLNIIIKKHKSQGKNFKIKKYHQRENNSSSTLNNFPKWFTKILARFSIDIHSFFLYLIFIPKDVTDYIQCET